VTAFQFVFVTVPFKGTSYTLLEHAGGWAEIKELIC